MTESESESEYAALGQRGAHQDHDAVDELVEPAGERGDLTELRRPADSGNTRAAGQMGGTGP